MFVINTIQLYVFYFAFVHVFLAISLAEFFLFDTHIFVEELNQIQ